jgi:hypothetical protein
MALIDALIDTAARRRAAVSVGLVLLLALTAGCARLGLSGRQAPAEDIAFAKQYLALFPTRSYPAMEMGMDASMKDPQIRQKLVQMASLFPAGEPTAVTLIASTTRRSGSTSTSNLSFQYQYPGRWLLANVVVERKGQAPVVKGVQVQPLRDSLDRINRVSFAGLGPAHYAVVAVAGIVMLFVLYTFILAIRSPAPGMKWVWAIFVLVGVGRFGFNWTTGILSIIPLSIELFGSGFSRPTPFDPLVITTTIPIGAIVYLIQRREWRQESAPPSDPA